MWPVDQMLTAMPRDNGFLRYWTVSNIPLFLLAAPMLFVLYKSGTEYLTHGVSQPTAQKNSAEAAGLKALIQSTAASQVLLAVLLLTKHHVQIITRISSGSPLWYLWLAEKLVDKDTAGLGNKILTFAVMYASIQAVLFTSFLPPA